MDKFDFSGVTFDIACGTGVFARALKEKYLATKTNGAVPNSRRHTVFGFDIVPGMLKICIGIVVPKGWELVWRHNEFVWATPQTGDDICSAIYKFERADEATRRDLVFTNREKSK